MLLFTIYNVQTESFNPPFVARDVDDAKEMIRKAIIGGRDVSLLVELENLDLYIVGSFDAKTGELVNDLEHLITLDSIPLPEHVEKLINKLKEVKDN